MRALYDLPAPAKINWFLHITGRRADGLHTLQSLMQLISLQDTLHIELTSAPTITREGAPELGDNDLCVRAARLLQAHAGIKTGCHIRLEKRIPTGAGLGGGSSDAATVLIALNRLWKITTDNLTLQKLALQLGADVPFFIFGQTAFAQGIGEQLLPASWPCVPLLIVKPSQGVPTASAYGHIALKRDSDTMEQPTPPALWTHAVLAQTTRNDMQPVAQLLAPEVTLALDIASSYGHTLTRMSGSGSAVFSMATAEAAQFGHLPPVLPGWFAAHANTLERHPLLDA